jgi:cell division protein FtsW
VVLVALLCGIGLMMVLSASSVIALRDYGGSWIFFQRQAMWVLVGVLAMGLAARLDYHVWQRMAIPLLALSFALLALVLVPGVGLSAGGSTRWLGVGIVRIQPSELAKLALLLFAADLAVRRAGQIADTRAVLRPVGLVTAGLATLVMLQPDMGTTALMVFVALVVVFVGGARLRTLAKVGVGVGLGSLVLARLEPYRWERVFAFLHPWSDLGNTGYQVAQSMVALGTGHVTGIGLGASRAKWGFLPNAHTDFIFAIIGEELGLIGTLGVLILFAALAVTGVRIALAAPDRFGTLIASGITAWIIGQAAVNMGAVTGTMPVTGVPLPFVSFGGSSLVVAMAAAGILLNIAKQATNKRKPAETAKASKLSNDPGGNGQDMARAAGRAERRLAGSRP